MRRFPEYLRLARLATSYAPRPTTQTAIAPRLTPFHIGLLLVASHTEQVPVSHLYHMGFVNRAYTPFTYMDLGPMLSRCLGIIKGLGGIRIKWSGVLSP